MFLPQEFDGVSWMRINSVRQDIAPSGTSCTHNGRLASELRISLSAMRWQDTVHGHEKLMARLREGIERAFTYVPGRSTALGKQRG